MAKIRDVLKQKGFDIYRDRSQGDPYSPLTGGEEGIYDEVMAGHDPTYNTRTDGYGKQNSNTAGKLMLANQWADQEYKGQTAPPGAGTSDHEQSQAGNWQSQAMAQQTSLLQQMFDRQVAEQNRIASEQAAREAENKTRRDDLYERLKGRASQSLSLDPTQDPIIKGQVDSYRAEQERALRNVRSDAAEGGQRLRPTQDRMASERVAQGVASMQSELMARELGSRRSEIMDALSGMGGILTADQQTGLQRELSQLDNIIRQQQVNSGNSDIDLRRELGLGQLGLGRDQLGLDRDLGFAGIDLQRELGQGGLSNDLLRAMLQNQQFYSDLGLRDRTQDDYYDLVRRGRIGNQI